MKNPLIKVLYTGALLFIIGQSTLAQQTTLDYGYGTSDGLTLNVGAQEWLGKNLNVGYFANGDLIPEAKSTAEWRLAGKHKKPAWCYLGNDPANGRIYGRLYNWYAVTDPRGLAPLGWHVPTDDERTALINYLGGLATAGNSLKSTSGWHKKGNGTNKSGMAALPGGYRGANGTFYDLGRVGYWWTSTAFNKHNAVGHYLYFEYGKAVLNVELKSCGYSVRCLKD